MIHVPEYIQILARADLERRRLQHLTLADADRQLRQGRITQEDFDVFYDAWATLAPRWSLSPAAVDAAAARLIARYSRKEEVSQ